MWISFGSFSRSSSDDVDLLQRELIVIQQHMNDVAMEKEAQLERFRVIFRESHQLLQRLDPIGRTFDQVNECERISID